jgi:polyphosphate kinase 2 (PPK2 family)
MDTSGKDGSVRRVVGSMNPAGVRITSFKKPTDEELSHDFLWRIDKALPPPGHVGVFNRSQYEDVLVVRVHDLVPESEWSTRYDRINEFEHRIVDAGTHLVKVMLHISKAEQKERLAERLEDPAKYWKYNAGDLHERVLGRLPGGVPGRPVSAAPPTQPRGTSSPATASGTATGSSRTCSSTPCAT